MTLNIHTQKVKGTVTVQGVSTKIELIDTAIAELKRQKAVARCMASFGQLPYLQTNEELEALDTNHFGDVCRS